MLVLLFRARNTEAENIVKKYNIKRHISVHQQGVIYKRNITLNSVYNLRNFIIVIAVAQLLIIRITLVTCRL